MSVSADAFNPQVPSSEVISRMPAMTNRDDFAPQMPGNWKPAPKPPSRSCDWIGCHNDAPRVLVRAELVTIK